MKKLIVLLTITTCFLLYTQFLTLQYLMWVSDRTQFLIVDRELNAATRIMKMFENNKKISKEEREYMKDRYINAMREFVRSADNFLIKYPKRPEFKQLKKLTNQFFGVSIQDYPVNKDFEETLKSIREGM